MVSSIAPETAKLMLAIAILCFAVYKTYNKGMTRWEKEKEDNSRKNLIQSKDYPQSTYNLSTEQHHPLLEDCDVTGSNRALSSDNVRHDRHLVSKDSASRIRGDSYASGGYYPDRDRVVSVFSEKDEYDITAEQSCDRTISVIVGETKMILPTTTFSVLGGLWTINALLLFFLGFFDQCDWQRLLILCCTFPLLLGFIIAGVRHVSG
jgi:hypothetical protein